jgi:hypothetical protein
MSMRIMLQALALPLISGAAAVAAAPLSPGMNCSTAMSNIARATSVHFSQGFNVLPLQGDYCHVQSILRALLLKARFHVFTALFPAD